MKSVRLPVYLAVAALSAAVAFGAFARLSCAAEELWQTDFKAAQSKAKEEKKYLLVDFTGSDWCGWCIKLRKEVFDTEPFKAEAPKQFVLVELDFPQKKELPAELKKQNEELRDKYDIKGYPSILLMDAAGEVIARTGYREGGPDGYLKHLADFSKVYQIVLAAKAKLEKSQGLDRAKLLDTIIDSYEKLGNESKEIAAWSKEIVALDPDNKAGLKVKYEFTLGLNEAMELLQTRKASEAAAVLDKVLAMKGVSGELLQKGYMAKVEIAFSERNAAGLVNALKQAKAAAPESPMVKQIDALTEQFKKLAEAQEAADKLEAALANTEGADRAKRLDELIEAKQKLASFDPKAGASIAKWTKEIVALDADNKAGLKNKYQFKAALTDALQLMRAGKADEASAALDKALETTGVSADDMQQGHFFKAQIAASQKNNDEAIAHFKKALDASPNSRLAAVIQARLSQLENAKKAAAEKKPASE